ncbi:putative 26S proteasome regulatory subunit [Sporothrix epigloea]|uniref:26S proteasome regulatory subunit n=1 Tax=Sporothrix epigloea TaxID=1892477 RepID=A0ABP0D5M1_9PEZI
MNNIHAPTVPAGPTTARAANGNSKQLSFAELQKKKDNMEAELSALSSVLTSHGVDMNSSLLTSDGFPRSDIDVAQIRTTRSRIIHLRNDYKELIGVIEKLLHEHFASLDADDSDEAAGNTNGGAAAGPVFRDSIAEAIEPAFAKVNSVVEGSPAAEAGLRAGDQIRRFGYVNQANNDRLAKVGECVAGNEGVNIPPQALFLFAPVYVLAQVD